MFVRGETLDGLEAPAEVVGCHEVSEVRGELGVVIVVEALDGRFLDGAVHPFDLAVGPGVLHLGGAMLDAVFPAGAPEDVLHGRVILLTVLELDAIVGEHDMDSVGNDRDELAQERRGNQLGGQRMQFDIGELGGPIDGGEQ